VAHSESASHVIGKLFSEQEQLKYK
jgi:hypothetical protein